MQFVSLWLRAQFINFLIVVVLYLIGLLSSLPAGREGEASGILLLIAGIFLAFSFVGGIPLLLLYYYLERMAINLPAPSNWVLRYLAMSVITFVYAAVLLLAVFQQFDESMDPELYLFCLPGTLSILIALAYAHYKEHQRQVEPTEF